MKICCIGAGYVGGPTMAMIANKAHDIEVEVVDMNAARIAAWNGGKLPIYEPGLDALVQGRLGKNLRFSTDVAGGIRSADIIFVAVNTPTKTYGVGAGRGLVGALGDPETWILAPNARGFTIEVLSNPEFHAEGTAVAELEAP
ncbi:MAG: nucleotide sugar dehydrogenase, partial [Opitutaceae bacterium]